MWMSIQEPYLLIVRHDDFFPDPRREDDPIRAVKMKILEP